MSSRLPKDTGDEVVFYLKSLELERVRCVVGFVEQNMAPKVKAQIRKDKHKSQRIGKNVQKEHVELRGNFIFCSGIILVRWRRQALGSSLRKSYVQEKVVHLIEYSSFLFPAAVVIDW